MGFCLNFVGLFCIYRCVLSSEQLLYTVKLNSRNNVLSLYTSVHRTERLHTCLYHTYFYPTSLVPQRLAVKHKSFFISWHQRLIVYSFLASNSAITGICVELLDCHNKHHPPVNLLISSHTEGLLDCHYKHHPPVNLLITSHPEGLLDWHYKHHPPVNLLIFIIYHAQ